MGIGGESAGAVEDWFHYCAKPIPNSRKLLVLTSREKPLEGPCTVFPTPQTVYQLQTGVGLLQVALEGEADAAMQAIARTAKHRLERGIWTSPGAGQLTHHTLCTSETHPCHPPCPFYESLFPPFSRAQSSSLASCGIYQCQLGPDQLKVPAWLHVGIIHVSCNLI